MTISFNCPHCGLRTEVGDQYAGQSGPCAGCGRTVSIPGVPGAAPHMGPAPAAGPPPRSNKVVWIVILVVCLGLSVPCCGILLGLLLPAVQSARDAARRAMCMNNMKQISLAMMMYETDHGSFPPAYTVDEDGRPLHSWRVLILPYLDETGLYNQIALDEPWDSPNNRALADMMPAVYACQATPTDAEMNQTSYAMIVGEKTISDGPNAVSSSDITDDMDTTIMIVEAAGCGLNWMEPVDLNADEISYQINDGSGNGIRSDHSGQVNVAFCDGSVQSLFIATDPEEIEAMSTRNGGETVYSVSSPY